MAQKVWTVLELIRWADDRFRKEGIPTPRLDAEVLLASALGTDRVGLYTHFDQPLKSEELAIFRQLIVRRLKREPVAYILGKKEFWSLPFKITPDVLIPRPETEILVEEALKILSSRGDGPAEIMEIGTGSGVISVALAKERPDVRITATDISPKALGVAFENARLNGVEEAIQFLPGDLFEAVPRGKEFDLILTNPPYVPAGEIPSLMPEVRDYEPRVALEAGSDGLDLFRRALPQLTKFLRPKGWFLAEFGGHGQDREILRMAENTNYLDSFDFIKDLAGINRVFKARKKC
ncbi:MAG TPA: peptide chain release factor N(5)-glutamine methyltransferase [Thermodesulfobacteriota bacterium]|nr:peptide chain release factor N(5)-glutamine methyltransferase [Thermodesulfobacteriota bacterium]